MEMRSTIVNKSKKIKRSSAEIIAYMRDVQGITFDITTEEEAERYIANVNNYFRTAAYRRNYKRTGHGSEKGKYIDLDFAYLKEISFLEMRFRDITSNMVIDVEHALKVKIITDVENNPNSDGYDVVEAFLNEHPLVIPHLENNGDLSFTKDLFDKYFRPVEAVNQKTGKTYKKIEQYDDCPVWVIAELMSMSDLIKFTDFYYSRNPGCDITAEILNIVRDLRNATAHNNALFENLAHTADYVPKELSEFTKGLENPEIIATRPMLEFTALMYCYKKIVSGEVKSYRMPEIYHLFEKTMVRHAEYFEKNELIKKTYKFGLEMIHL